MSVMTITHPSADLTHADARRITDEARTALRNVVEWAARAAELIDQAWAVRADVALGYPSWVAYCESEFAAVRELRWPVPQRVETVAALREAGMSTRAIGAAIGRSDERVRDDLRKADAPAGPVVGINGRTYAAALPAPRKPTGPALTMVEQTLVDLESAGVHGLTSIELGRRHRRWTCPWATLSDLHRTGRLARLAGDAGTRDGYATYVGLEHVHGRDTEAPGRRSRRRLDVDES